MAGFETVADIEKAIHDVKERMTTLASRTDVDAVKAEAGQQWETMKRDLMDASQKLAALQQAQAFGAAHQGGGESSYQKYIGGSEAAPKVRWTGEDTKDEGYVPGILDDDKPVDEWGKQLRDFVGQANHVAHFKFTKQDEGRPFAEVRQRHAPHTMNKIKRHLKSAPDAIKKIFGDGSLVGGEFIPDIVSPNYERDLMLTRRLEAAAQSMPMSSKELRIPFVTTGLRPFIKGAPIVDDAAQYRSTSLVTNSISVSAVGLAVRAQVDEDASEDSIVATEPLFRNELVMAINDAFEDGMVNGNTNPASLRDTGMAGWNPRSRWGTSPVLGTTGDHRFLFAGLRDTAFIRSATTNGNAVQTYAGLNTGRGLLDSPQNVSGTDGTSSLIVTPSPEYLLKMMAFAEVITVDKLGPKAVLLTGQLAAVAGMAVIPSEFVDKQYNTAGVYDDSTKTTTGCLIWNSARWKVGTYRNITVEVDKDVVRGVFNYVATRRCIFFDLDKPTLKKNSVWIFNLTP